MPIARFSRSLSSCFARQVKVLHVSFRSFARELEVPHLEVVNEEWSDFLGEPGGVGGEGCNSFCYAVNFLLELASWCYAVNFLLELATRSWCYAVNFPLMPCWSERISSWSCMTSKKTMCTKHYSEDTSGSSLAGTQIIDRAWISLNNDWWPQHVNATFKKGQFSSCQKMSRPWCTNGSAATKSWTGQCFWLSATAEALSKRLLQCYSAAFFPISKQLKLTNAGVFAGIGMKRHGRLSSVDLVWLYTYSNSMVIFNSYVQRVTDINMGIRPLSAIYSIAVIIHDDRLLLLLLLDVHPFFDSKKLDGDVMVRAPLDLYSFWMGSDGLSPPITSASLAVLGPNGTLGVVMMLIIFWSFQQFFLRLFY